MSPTQKLLPASPSQAEIIDRALESLTVPEMREIARAFGWPLKGIRRDRILLQMREHYLDEKKLVQALDSLDPDDRRLLALLAWIGPTERMQLFPALQALLGVLPDGWVVGDVEPTLVRRFIERGLLFRLDTQLYQERVGTLDTVARRLLPIPELLDAPRTADRLKPIPSADPLGLLLVAWHEVKEAAPFQLESPYHGTITSYGRESTHWPITEKDRERSWGGNKPIEIQSALSPFPSALRHRVALAFGGGEPHKVAFFLALLQSMGMIKPGNRQTYVGVDEEMLHDLLACPPAEQWARLMEGWYGMSYGVWDELSWMQQQHPSLRLWRLPGAWQFQPTTFSQHITGMRQRLFDVLRWLPTTRKDDGGWVDFESLARLLFAIAPNMIAPPLKPYPTWFIGDDKEYAYDPNQWTHWQASCEQVLRFAFQGPLRWLGLVENATKRLGFGKLLAVRLTPLGAAMMAGESVAVGRVPPPDWDGLQVSVTPTVAAGPLVALLSQYATEEGVEKGRLRFRFTRDAAFNAFETGASPQTLRARLQSMELTPPDAVVAAWEQWWGRWGLVHRYDDLALIELSDELLVRELLMGTTLGQHVVYRCSPTALAIPKTQVDALTHLLESKGYFPRSV